MKVRFHAQIAEIGSEQWNRLAGDHNPFVRYEFLAALESTGAVGAGTGWRPFHLAMLDEHEVIQALMPLYLKTDSWGEFVFDFAWANAYVQCGLKYYPKLVNAIPFTPASGPRFLVKEGADPDSLAGVALAAIEELSLAEGISSLHSLFFDEAWRERWQKCGAMIRTGCQFHWLNHGYSSYDDLLSQFTSKRRRATRRERRKVREQGISLRRTSGTDMSREDWRHIYHFYRSTFEQKSGYVPFPEAFFMELRETMPERILAVFAERGLEVVAGAFFLVGSDCLFGRYWGAYENIDSLHFEVCYHQGIEFCIERGLSRFEPGAQGEFKILRGFEPLLTWSAHHIYHDQMARAIGAYLTSEDRQVRRYRDAAHQLLPFRRQAVATEPNP